MRQRRDGLRLALEARVDVRIERDRLGKHLDRDVAVELAVACAIDLAHAARADLTEDLVEAELRSGGKRHLRTPESYAAAPDAARR